MTRRKKQTYALLMMFGAVAMFLDRCAMREALEPQPVSAGVAMAPIEGGGSPATLPGLVVPELPFPKNLPAVNVLEVRDMFAPPHLSAAARSDQELNAARPVTGADGGLDTAAFAAQHRLQAVLLDEGLKIAVISDRLLQPGDELTGCKLKHIAEHQVTFECHDGDISLQFSAEKPPLPR